MKIAILTMPNAPFLAYLLKELKEKKVTVSSLLYDEKEFSDKDRLIHEKRTQGKLPLFSEKEYCNGVDIFRVKNHNDDKCIEYLKKNEFDLLVNCESPRILNNSLINAANIGVLNCHPGLLPAYRGCSCVEWAVYNNDPVANTVHFVSEGIDEGDVVKSKVVHISKSESYVDLRVKVYREGINLLASVIESYCYYGPQNIFKQNSEKASYYKPIDDNKLKEVIEKLNNGNYLFQT